MLNEKELRVLDTLSEDSWVSGELLANNLKISRTAVWKYIKKLTNLGYEIDSSRKKGYRLIKLSEIHPMIRILKKISLCFQKISYHKVTISTQQEAIKYLFNEKHNIIVFADKQTGGRGHENTNWPSPEGGIYFSAGFLPFKLFQNNLGEITNIFKQAVEYAFNNHQIKIAVSGDDLIINGRKIGGILEEHFSEGDRSVLVVIGVGIYLTNYSEDQESIYSLTGKSLNRWQMLADIIEKSCKNLQEVKGLMF